METPIIVIAASAGGLDPLKQIVAEIPTPFCATMFVVMHIGNQPSVLPTLLTKPNARSQFATNGEVFELGRIYVAPPDHHMTVDKTTIWLSRSPKVHATRPAADPLFISAADAFGERVVGVVLSGGDGDGARGLVLIKERGGKAYVQDPDDAAKPGMPLSAIRADDPEELPAAKLASLISRLSRSS